MLVLQGNLTSMPEALGELRLLPLAERQVSIGRGRRSLWPVLVLAAAMGLVAFNLVPVATAFFGAAVIMLLVRALSLREAYDAIEWPILIMLGALIPVSDALRATGGTDLIASWLSAAAAHLCFFLRSPSADAAWANHRRTPWSVTGLPRPLPEPGTIEDLMAYGRDHVDQFGGLYIDPPGGTSVVMLFTADLERHQAAVNAIVPGTRVRQVAHTEAELTALIESLDFEGLEADGIQMVTAAVDVRGNRVTMDVKSNDPTVELRLELAHAGLLDVTVHPVPGPWANVESGEGWRLLVAGQAGGQEAYIVRAATDAEAWGEMWATIGLEGAAPAVDLADDVVVSFAHGIGSSCPEIRLDGVTIAGGVVFSETSDPLGPRACTADLAGAVVLVVAIARDALPDDGFTLQLRADDIGEAIEVPLP